MAQYEHVPCHVVDARYLGDYKAWLEFNDGRKGVVDLATSFTARNSNRCATVIDLQRSSSITGWRPSPGKTESTSRPTTSTKG